MTGGTRATLARAPLACALIACALWPATAAAGGIFVPGAGPHAQARAGAFTARADDPSALLHNPAGFAKLDGTQIALGANLVSYDLTYQRDGLYEASGVDPARSYEGLPYPEVKNQARPRLGIGSYQVIPLIAASTDLGRPDWPVRFGAGVFVPQGYAARRFPESHDLGGPDPAPGPQRYDIIEQDPTTIQPSLAVAYSPLAGLDLGARLSWGIASVSGKKATWAIRNYEEYEGRDAVFTLEKARDWFVPGFGLGLLFRPATWVEVGAAYNSQNNVRAVGRGSSVIGDAVLDGLTTVPAEDEFAECAPGGREGALMGCIDVTIPMTATVGGRLILRERDGRERADLELDLRWENWSAASDQVTKVDAVNSETGRPLNETVSRHGFRDVLSVRLGGSYGFALGPGTLVVRAGAAYDTAAAPDSFTRVDVDGKARTTLATGVAFDTGRFRIDVGGGIVLQPTVVVEPCQPPDGPTVENPGCDGTGMDRPVRERNAPDPIQPTFGPLNQVESPFNAGRYESGYILFSAGITARF